MTRLTWDQVGPRQYETGIEKGVLYPLTGPGVVWNGLISIEESFIGGENTSYHFDGVKYMDSISPKNYQATISAFSAPPEFTPSTGERAIVPGFILTRQPRTRFGLSYRTTIGDGAGYKLHLVYNAIASPTGRSYASLQATVTAPTFSWKIDAVPPMSNTHRPSAHYTLDSTKVDPVVLANIETILYGSLTTNPTLITVEELESIVL